MADAGKSAANLYSGVGIAISDNQSNRIVWDSTQLEVEGGGAEPGSVTSRLSLAPSSGQIATAKILHDDVAVGSVRVWVLGSEDRKSVV